jgi:hypothetical protein
MPHRGITLVRVLAMESPYLCADSVRESCNSHAKICGETVYTHFDVDASENRRSSLSKRSKDRSLIGVAPNQMVAVYNASVGQVRMSNV